MRSILTRLYLSVVLLVPFLACQKTPEKTPDINVNPDTLEIFAPNLVSTGMYERDIAIDSAGTEIIFTMGDHKQTRRILVRTTLNGKVWSAPEILSFSGMYHDIEPFLTKDGTTLFFASTRPMSADSTREDYNIWSVERPSGEWGIPSPVDTVVNTMGDEFYPSLAENGNLYFTATRPEGLGKEDIYLSVYRNGNYSRPVRLDSTVNSPYYEFNAWVSPDESLLLFSSYGRPDGLGGGDLYFSRRAEDGTWLQARNLGTTINTPFLDYCPFIDLQRGNLYFTSERMSSRGEPISHVQDLIEFTTHPQNGMGDIYRISLQATDLY